MWEPFDWGVELGAQRSSVIVDPGFLHGTAPPGEQNTVYLMEV